MIPRIKKFQETVYTYYRAHKRDLPWRRTKNPYYILVSEIMLQQTQVERVRAYYATFIQTFPTPQALADAPLPDVLRLWKGLGYNRRAINLKRCAEEVVKRGSFPRTYDELLELPGIGQSTAGALMNFAFNIPTPFIETNIRSVFIHAFFRDRTDVSDKELASLIEQSIDREHPREWFYALYDYGTHLKKTVGNQNVRSKHYKKQSTFKGSRRELRAKVLFYKLDHPKSSATAIAKALKEDNVQVESVLADLIQEGVVFKV